MATGQGMHTDDEEERVEEKGNEARDCEIRAVLFW